MPKVISHLHVRDFDSWLPTYQGLAEARAQARSTNHRLYRAVDDPNDVFILMEAEDPAYTEAAMATPELRARMQAGGLLSPPEVHVLVPLTPKSTP